jgi:hypothetical protein
MHKRIGTSFCRSLCDGDEYTRQCLALHVAWKILSNDIIDVQADASSTSTLR